MPLVNENGRELRIGLDLGVTQQLEWVLHCVRTLEACERIQEEDFARIGRCTPLTLCSQSRCSGNQHGLVRKYGIMMTRRDFREKAETMGWTKYR